MKQNYLKQLKTLLLLGSGVFCAQAIEAQTVTSFAFTGAMQTFTVPPCVGTLTIDLKGAQGATAPTYNALGGKGGRLQAVINVTSGQVLNIFVGGTNAYNGGGLGATYGGVGGGATDIRIGGTGLGNRVLVAGGGAGGGVNCFDATNPGGDGGGTTGGSGYQCNQQTNYVGTGGTQTGGGTSLGSQGAPGSLGLGGNGGNTYGGGGGGGYYGGGGGSYGGGGGGSSYAGSGTLSVVHTQGFQTGNGALSMSYTSDGAGVTVTPTNPAVCEGDGITLTAGSTLSFTWSTNSNLASITVTPPSTTDYTVFGTNNLGCISRKIVTVIVNPLPDISATVSPSLLCVGSTATMSASGASSYMWNGNQAGITVTVEPVVTTNYTITGTSSVGCVNTQTVDVNVNANVLQVTPNTSVCAGNAIAISAAGAVSYVWHLIPLRPFSVITVTPSSTTNYSVSATDQFNCPLSGSVTVAVHAKPTVGANANPQVVCVGEPVLLTANGADTYVWNSLGGGSTVSVIPTVNIPTHYTVTGTNAAGCSNSVIVTVNVNKCTGVAEIAGGSSLKGIYPNPGSGLFTVNVDSPGKGATLRVYNGAGSLVQTIDVTSADTILDMTGAQSGLYLVTLCRDNQIEAVSRLIKQ